MPVVSRPFNPAGIPTGKAAMLDSGPRSDASHPAPLLSARGITKLFGTFRANDAIDLDIEGARIHALLGENGAGKSTLVKIIYGLIEPTSGELQWLGRRIELASPAAARALGISMVLQHFSLFDNLTVAENVALGLARAESLGSISARLAEVSRAYGLPLEPDRDVWRLSVGERQRIEIVRALMQDPRLLILDEPTSVLTPQETDRLFVTLERLKAEGRAILYISHKLDEVQRLCDTATILRAGRKVAACDPRSETAQSLARMMVGADVREVKPTVHRRTATPRLVVENLTLDPGDLHGVRLSHVSLAVGGGEIFGIAGVAGNGQDELFAALSGERLAPDAGDVVIDGRPCGHLDITSRRRLGAAFVPAERLGHAVAPHMRLSENALLTAHAAGPRTQLSEDALLTAHAAGMVRHGLVDASAMLAAVDRVSAEFDVRKATRDPEAASLSGGNLQKFVVGREILREPSVLVASQPTWGVDAGAAAVIRQALIDLAARGAAVLLISQDLDELIEISDRIAVMFAGRLSDAIAAAAATRDMLGLLMGGGRAALPADDGSFADAS
jgi:simple sugar transport system ATP-binding protein